MSTDFTGIIPFGWKGGEAVTKWWRGQHLHLYRLRKDCAQCGQEMTIDVTKAAIMGTAKNAGLQLTRCVKCRSVAKETGGTSRPTTINRAPAVAESGADPVEFERLQRNDEKLFLIVRRLQTIMPATTLVDVVEAVEKMIEGGNRLKAEYDSLRTKYELQPRIEAAARQPNTAMQPLTMAESQAYMWAQLEETKKQAQNTDTTVLPKPMPW